MGSGLQALKKFLSIVSKIKSVGTPLSDKFPEISQGLIAYDAYQGQSEAVIKSTYHYNEKVKPELKNWLWEKMSRLTKWHGIGKNISTTAMGLRTRDPKFFVEVEFW